jgi:hypothetical protein
MTDITAQMRAKDVVISYVKCGGLIPPVSFNK